MSSHPSHEGGESTIHGDSAGSMSNLDNYRFTFNLSTRSGSGGSSIIEPDPNPQEWMDDSESLTDSVVNFPEEFGRTYNAYRAGSYAFPNDRLEQERLRLQHDTLTMLFGGRLHYAPLSKANPPRNILDIATGLGDWAIQMGDQYPHSQIVATDLSPIQPPDVPPNVNFYIEDSSQPWDYSEDFDYVHSRVTAGCWSSFKDQIVQQAFDNLTPGGWFEAQEFDCAVGCDDGTLDPTGPMATWYRELAEAAVALDRPLEITKQMKQDFIDVGFVDVHERVFKVPCSGWARDERLKEIGRLWEKNLYLGLGGFSFHLFHRVFGRTPAAVEVSLVNVRREIGDPRVHAYMTVHVVWGRKPFPGETMMPS